MPRQWFKNQQYAQQIPEIKKRFECRLTEDKEATEIIIYGDIGSSFWGESISASDIDQALSQVKTSKIVVRINSPGGDAFDGIAIYNRLKDHPATVKVIVDGWACSAASIIAMGADELVMKMGAMLMIHEALTGLVGNKGDFMKAYDLLGKLDNSLIDIYMTKAKVERHEIEAMIKNETWFTAEEAIAIGFATAVTEEAPEQLADAEAFKNSVLARLKTSTPPAPQSLMNRFKRS
ncbi:MAG: head maturation protease, ClpP-related [Solibacillus sp.]